MSCKCKKDNCVCEKVRRIAAAQDEVNNDCCESGSCEQSIRDLVSPTGGNGADTIPFMLLCGCENTFAGLLPYFAWGVFDFSDGCSGPIPSPFFRVKKFRDDRECCAILELLVPSLCDTSPSLLRFENFFRTGVCVEVDLSCFTGITCFRPSNAPTASDNDVTKGMEAIKGLRESTNSLTNLNTNQ